MKFAAICGTIALAIVGVFGESAVVTLTTENFDAFIAENDAALVEFYAPWCGHCKRLEPEFEKAAVTLKGVIPLAKVDATVETALAERFDVRGYPTIKFFKKGKDSEYDGGRTDSTIVSWLQQNTGPAVNVADKTTAVASGAEVIFYGEFTSADSSSYKTFEKIADANRDAGVFYAHFNVAAESVTVIRKNEGESRAAGLSEPVLEQFVKNESFHLFAGISGDNFGRYMDRGLDIVWAALTEADFEKYSAAFREVAKIPAVRSAYSIVWLDVAKFASHADGALGISKFPGVVIQKKAGRYVYPSDAIDVDGLKKFFEDVAAGNVEKSIKSEPIPEKNDAPVKVVVAKEFQNIVLDENKDVLLEVYAPWCGHCKRLEPVYNEFAQKLVDSGVDHVVVAKMDGTANESPVEGFEWTGFPTLFWVPAGSTTPERYNGARSLEGFAEFVKSKASKPVVFKETATEKDEL